MNLHVGIVQALLMFAVVVCLVVALVVATHMVDEARHDRDHK